MTDPDKTVTGDEGFEKLPDGTLIIGDAAVRAQIKRQSKEAIAHAQETVIDPLNAETSKLGDSDYIEAP